MMPKSARFMAARAGVRAPFDRRTNRPHLTDRFRQLPHRGGARAVLLAMMIFALGALSGLVGARVTANAAGPREGACIALSMAATLGYLDDRQRRAVMRTLATAVNPDADLFPGGHRGLVQACDAVTKRG
jgi:hypothetical protein